MVSGNFSEVISEVSMGVMKYHQPNQGTINWNKYDCGGEVGRKRKKTCLGDGMILQDKFMDHFEIGEVCWVP